ncbi:hypothetical protein RhiirC2_795946 [Rhizophagus irregularis]|uniref:Uncharacterized protein n=1 Tax=Rhizophagus irregularis TaxID=588596 RepID=A0A2N1MAJ4_9GLOM|nr:hypothetical protein RhiirC2_795946 [Rhizophagus irregularis]
MPILCPITAIDFNSEITDFNEKLQAEYSEQEKEFENKASQLIASSTKVRSSAPNRSDQIRFY